MNAVATVQFGVILDIVSPNDLITKNSRATSVACDSRVLRLRRTPTPP